MIWLGYAVAPSPYWLKKPLWYVLIKGIRCSSTLTECPRAAPASTSNWYFHGILCQASTDQSLLGTHNSKREFAPTTLARKYSRSFERCILTTNDEFDNPDFTTKAFTMVRIRSDLSMLNAAMDTGYRWEKAEANGGFNSRPEKLRLANFGPRTRQISPASSRA